MFIAGLCTVSAQEDDEPDEIPLLEMEIEEIVVTAKTGLDCHREAKPYASVEEYLQTSENVGMIRRGNYAWEPTVNNMTAERVSVTIDGMKIFHACTDRMDPVTSYVEIINLSEVTLGSGFDANPNASNNIGGSLDLRLNKTGFSENGFSANVRSGYESNGGLLLGGADASYASPRFYVNSGAFRRQSGNYSAGGGEEVPFSQFTKNNFFTNLGYAAANGNAVEGTFIYDRAVNVGYPALAMDVASAEGLITSLSYTAENPFSYFHKWETKGYYNAIAHIMDDTKRPDVVMHMDMPGKSRTGGAYSTLSGQSEKHRYTLNWDAYYNQSYAEMTMYKPNEKPMFMLTWGDIRTLNTGLFAADEYNFNERHLLRLSAKGSFQQSGVRDTTNGLPVLRIYYPDMARYKNRITGNAAGRYQFKKNGWETTLGAGYGSRAPSVSEAYGYFLYNTFDACDYLGNPGLKNESSVETSLSLSKKYEHFEAKADVSYFFFYNYIIGKPAADLYPMTIGAKGVKAYENLSRAALLNTNLSLKYSFPEYFIWSGKAAFARGKDNDGGNLPLIAPLSYNSALSFEKNKFTAEAGISGASRQRHFSPEYGEDETPGYVTGNIAAGYSFKAGGFVFNPKTGVENILDKNYSTYSDWQNIPRKGRNIFVNLGVSFN